MLLHFISASYTIVLYKGWIQIRTVLIDRTDTIRMIERKKSLLFCISNKGGILLIQYGYCDCMVFEWYIMHMACYLTPWSRVNSYYDGQMTL